MATVLLDRPRRTAGPDATAATLASVRVVLADCRAARWDFPSAWSLALAMVDDPATAEAMEATRLGWFRAFRGVPATPAERAVTLVAVATMTEPTERVDVAVVG